MKRLIFLVLAVAALSFAAAGSVRADDAIPSPTTTIQCADGTTWVLDQDQVDWFGDAVCDGGWSVVPQDTSSDSDLTSDSVSGIGAGDFSLSSSMAPDPTAYVTEVTCPNGQVWAVASGDDFVCPAA